MFEYVLETVKLFTYQKMLDRLDADNSHILLANGFNRSLGIDTSYENIFIKSKI